MGLQTRLRLMVDESFIKIIFILLQRADDSLDPQFQVKHYNLARWEITNHVMPTDGLLDDDSAAKKLFANNFLVVRLAAVQQKLQFPYLIAPIHGTLQYSRLFAAFNGQYPLFTRVPDCRAVGKQH